MESLLNRWLRLSRHELLPCPDALSRCVGDETSRVTAGCLLYGKGLLVRYTLLYINATFGPLLLEECARLGMVRIRDRSSVTCPLNWDA